MGLGIPTILNIPSQVVLSSLSDPQAKHGHDCSRLTATCGFPLRKEASGDFFKEHRV